MQNTCRLREVGTIREGERRGVPPSLAEAETEQLEERVAVDAWRCRSPRSDGISSRNGQSDTGPRSLRGPGSAMGAHPPAG